MQLILNTRILILALTTYTKYTTDYRDGKIVPDRHEIVK